MAISEERAACLFWTGTISAFLFTILYSSLCILNIGSVNKETCAFLEISTVASVLAFIVGIAYYCYKQKVSVSGSSVNDLYTHWTVSRHQHVKHFPKESDIMKPVAEHDIPTEFECSICSDDKEETLIIQLKCSHYFHKTCIQQWFRSDQHMSCPLCRMSQLRSERLIVLTIIPGLQPPEQSQV